MSCKVGDPGISEKEDADSVFMQMVCPSGTNPDDSPLYVLCCNDTCSFTWTGAEHINQVSLTGLHIPIWFLLHKRLLHSAELYYFRLVLQLNVVFILLLYNSNLLEIFLIYLFIVK